MKGNEEDQKISSIPFTGKLAQMAGVEIQMAGVETLQEGTFWYMLQIFLVKYQPSAL